MGDTYLSSDESLILSTHNILIDGVVQDLMLTSRRLILIDNSVTPFHLRTIPLDSIITAVSGTDMKGDPIITVSHMDPSRAGAPQPIDFIFIRKKGEQRSTECSEWAETLRNHAAEARSGALSAGTLPYDPVKSFQPRMSATYRIETFSPRKPVIEEYPVKEEPALPPEPELSEDERISPDIDESSPSESPEPVEPSGLPVSSPSDAEEPEESIEPEPHGTGISGAGNYISSLPAPEELSEAPDPSVPHGEISDTITPYPEQNQVISPDDVVKEMSPDSIPEPENPISLQHAVSSENDEIPELSDAAMIWAEAARSAVPLPLQTPEKPVPDIISFAAPIADDSTDQVVPVKDIREKPAADIAPEPETPDTSVPYNAEETRHTGEPEPEIVPIPLVSSATSPPALPVKSSPSFYLMAIVIILVVFGGAILGAYILYGSGDSTQHAVVPNITYQTPVTVPTTIPADGVWVRIEYPGNFIGEVGNTELMHPVSGTGVRLYKILWNDRVVQASAQKQDNSGDTLTVEIYNAGILIKRSSVRSPMGSVEILIDPTTGRPPGIRDGDIP